jgi:hypothetical protein
VAVQSWEEITKESLARWTRELAAWMSKKRRAKNLMGLSPAYWQEQLMDVATTSTPSAPSTFSSSFFQLRKSGRGRVDTGARANGDNSKFKIYNGSDLFYSVCSEGQKRSGRPFPTGASTTWTTGNYV